MPRLPGFGRFRLRYLIYAGIVISTIAFLWALSETIGDYLAYGYKGVCVYSVGTHPGGITVQRTSDWPDGAWHFNLGPDPDRTGWQWCRRHWDDIPETESENYWTLPNRHFLGFAWQTDQWLGVSLFEFDVPFWFIAVVLLGLPMVPSIFRKKRTANECAGCGYDLRASPDRCPECGVIR